MIRCGKLSVLQTAKVAGYDKRNLDPRDEYCTLSHVKNRDIRKGQALREWVAKDGCKFASHHTMGSEDTVELPLHQQKAQ